MKIWSKTIAIALAAFTLSSIGLSSSSAQHNHSVEHGHTGAAISQTASISQTSSIDSEALISTAEQCALACIFCILTFAAIRRFSSKLIGQKIAQAKIALVNHRNISELLTINFKPPRGLILRM